MYSVVIDPAKLRPEQLVRVYCAAAAACGRPGVEQFLDVDTGRERTRQMLERAESTLVSASNRQGWSVLPYRARALQGDARTLTKRYLNPHQPGTRRGQLWAMVPDGGTIAEYIAVRGWPARARSEIAWWARHHDWLIVHHYVRV